MPTPSYLGESMPPIVGGFSSNFYWGRFVLNISFEYKVGHYIPSFNTFKTINTRNRHISDQNRWRAPGDEASIPAVSLLQPVYAQYALDNSFERGDYLRLTFLTLGYNLPASVLNALHLQGARITFSANNLLTFTNYKGVDPALMGAFDYPNTRKYNLSLNINF